MTKLQELYSVATPRLWYSKTTNKGSGSLHTLTDGTTEELDENLIPVESQDSEGNPVHPVFSTDEQLEPLFCGDCLEEIE